MSSSIRGGAAEPAAVLAQADADVGRAPHDAGHAGGDLAAGVVDLHPDRAAAGPARLGPLGERLERCVLVEDDTGGAGQRLGVDHDIAGDQQPGAACRPPPVQREQLLVGQLAVAGHVLLHRGLRDPVLQYLSGAQMQRREQLAGHVDSLFRLDLLRCVHHSH
ncbi:hypothetical protein [Streptomyces sp. MW-W600-10]|uniref:hypothetical protein n=1 Tax=Streptomyces sp. MW-W600-10 TaxID=2829819 RepID=UPI0027E580B7|nr:hypothetical protein [Streptomyces sp. MW-W600-10]